MGEDRQLKVQQKQEVKHSGETTKPEKYFVPAVDIFETEKEVIVIAEMPGVVTEGVDVSLEDDVLTIQGKMAPEEPEKDIRVLLREYESGNYLRRFTVAETIDQNNIAASLTNGLLKITLPKIMPAQPRKIKVTAE